MMISIYNYDSILGQLQAPAMARILEDYVSIAPACHDPPTQAHLLDFCYRIFNLVRKVKGDDVILDRLVCAVSICP
jgi:hypothetical protein